MTFRSTLLPVLFAVICTVSATSTHVPFENLQVPLGESLYRNIPDAGSWLKTRIDQRNAIFEKELEEMPWLRDANGPWRLPSHLRPSAYWLTLRPYFPSRATMPAGRNFTFDGSVGIRMRSTERTDRIVLHARNLTIRQDEIALVDPLGNAVPLSNEPPMTNSTYDFLVINLASGVMLLANVDYTLNINYTGIIFPVRGGGMLQSTVQYNGMTKWIVSTQLESTKARKVFPCFDEPAMKAIFHVTIEHPEEMTALSNGMERGTEIIGMGWGRTMFKQTKKMSTYLLAIAVGELVSKQQRTQHGTLVRIWSWPGTQAYMDLALHTAVKSLEAGGNELLSPFPLEKEDLLAIPRRGAMENWGLVIFNYNLLLFDWRNEYPSQTMVIGLITHELAHQWFGDLVTTEWWDDIFLNEAMATFWAVRFIRQVFPQQEYWAMNEWISNINMAISLDSLPGSTSTVHHPTAGDPGSHEGFFGYATYLKGGALFRMLQSTLGDEVFINGLRRYIQKYGYGNAKHNDLWNEFSSAAEFYGVLDWNNEPLNVAQLMNPWIEQMHFPIVDVTASNGNLKFTQRPVVNVTASPPSPYGYQWQIPLWYTNSHNPDVTNMRWILPKCNGIISTNCTTNDTTAQMTEWEVENVGWRSFVHMRYDDNLFKTIIDQLVMHPESVDSMTKAQFLLAPVGSQKQTRTNLDVSLLFRDQRLFRVWANGISKLQNIEYMFRNHPSRVLVAVSAFYNLTLTFVDGTTRRFRQYTKICTDENIFGRSSFAHFQRYLEYIYENMYNITSCSTGDWNDCAVNQLIAQHSCRFNFAFCPTENHLQLFGEFVAACANSTTGLLTCNTIPPIERAVVYCSAAAATDENWRHLWSIYKREYQMRHNATTFDSYLQRQAQLPMLYGLSCTRNRDNIYSLLDELFQEDLLVFLFTTNYISQNTASMPHVWDYLESRVNLTTASPSYAALFMMQLVRTMNMDVYQRKLEIFRDTHQLNEAMVNAVNQAIALVRKNIQLFNRDGPIIDRWLLDHFGSQCPYSALG